jgi:hypothetical protein
MDVEKGCLNRCDTCLTGYDSVSYDGFITVSWKRSMKGHKIYALKPTNMKASLRVAANISSIVPVN